jgi:hypothetical protein
MFIQQYWRKGDFMNYIDLCLCFLILSGAFALICLGVLLLKTSATMKEVTSTMSILQVTMDKANKTLDDVNGKMEMLNAPVEAVSGFFGRDRSHSGVLASLLAIKSMFTKKSK